MNIKKKPKHITSIGGQAIIEGVMMRGPNGIGMAVRKSDGEIVTEFDETKGLLKKYKFLRIPIIRGAIALVDSLVIGMKALMFSSQFIEEEEESEKEELTEQEKKDNSKADDIAIYLAVAFSLVVTVILFMLIPNLIASFFKKRTENTLYLNLIEGVIRVSIFTIYLLIISKFKDTKRLFEYHGAEHKTIHAYENLEELTVENVKKYPLLHPRCGTSFLFNVMIISIILFSFFGWPNPVVRIITRVLLFPIVGGIAFELNRIIGKSESKIAYIISYPGLMMQKYITTKEPDDEQIEVAITALNLVKAEDRKLDQW